MTQSLLGFLVEGLVSILLVATIVYCVIVNRKLEALRRDQQGMRRVVVDLNKATTNAGNAIKALKQTVREADQGLGVKIETARARAKMLQDRIAAADQAASRLSLMLRHGKGNTVGLPEADTRRAGLEELRRNRLGFGIFADEGDETVLRGAMEEPGAPGRR